MKIQALMVALIAAEEMNKYSKLGQARASVANKMEN